MVHTGGDEEPVRDPEPSRELMQEETIHPGGLDELLALARDRTVRGRTHLLENISDLFLSPDGRLTDRERSLMTDILRKLIRDVEMSVRRDLAEQLARAAAAPHDLVVDLANEEIEVARPILMDSGILRDVDLVEIVRSRSREHRLVVALRDDVSEAVSDALVDTGEPDVIVELLKNNDARLSRRATEYLVAESRRIDRFREPLIQRRDLPPDLALKMYWWVSAALRRHILTRYSLDALRLDDAIVGATENALDQLRREPASASEQAAALVAQLDDDRALTPGFLIGSLRAGRFPVFLAGFARHCRVSAATAREILLDGGMETLAVACKAADIDRRDFATIFMLTRRMADGRISRETAEVNDGLRFYDQIQQEAAALVLRHWQLDPRYREAVGAMHARG